MVELYGERWSREELRRYATETGHLAGVRRARLQEGRERGVEVLEVRTGGGLDFTVVPDRGMGIADARFRGVPFAWMSPTGIVAPEHYEPDGAGWTRGFFGGLLTTCGLTNVGPAVEEEGERVGQHGRIAYVPAREVETGRAWSGDELRLRVRGVLREIVPFRYGLTLRRTIEARAGAKRLRLTDVVRNTGGRPAPLMLLYHVNLGYPLLAPGAEVVVPSRSVTPRDERAEEGVGRWDRVPEPTAGYRERVFYHDVRPDPDGAAAAGVLNPAFDAGIPGEGLGAYVRYDPDQLPRLVQWKMTSEHMYVVGLEPANCLPEGRVRERERGTLTVLEPGESRRFELEVGVLVGGELSRFRERYGPGA